MNISSPVNNTIIKEVLFDYLFDTFLKQMQISKSNLCENLPFDYQCRHIFMQTIVLLKNMALKF
jgi:hypothetical protein